MAEKKPEGFYIFGEFETRVEDIADEDLGRILRWMFASHNRGEMPKKGDLSPEAMVIFKMLKVKADAHKENSMRIRKRQSEATARRWKEKKERKETNSDYKKLQDTKRDRTSYPILSNPILSEDYTSKYSPRNKTTVPSASAPLGDGRSGRNKQNERVECPPEIVRRLGGYKQTATYEREEALRKDGFFEMTALEKAEYLERKRNE